MISLSHSLFDDFLTYSLFKSRCFSITHSLSLSFLLYLYILVSLSLSLFFYLSIILTHTFSIPFGHSSSRILHSSCHFFTNVASSSLSLSSSTNFLSPFYIVRTHLYLPTYIPLSQLQNTHLPHIFVVNLYLTTLLRICFKEVKNRH